MNNITNDFVWGTATASYQIEGAWDEAGKGESIWDRFTHAPGNIVNGDTGDVACDHYHLYKSDVALMKELNQQAYRFSIAWTRILPQGIARHGVNAAGLDFYDRLVDELLRSGIEPYATLFHWDLPQVLQDQGGWGNRSSADWFVEYADLVVKRLGDRVTYWTTFNEPQVIAFLGYRNGIFAPGVRDEKIGLAAAHNVLRAHGMALQSLRTTMPDLKYGIVLNLWPFHAASDKPEDVAAAEFGWQQNCGWFLQPLLHGTYPQKMLEEYGDRAPQVLIGDMKQIAQPLDYLGVNFYHREMVDAKGIVKVPTSEYTNMDWEVHAPSFRNFLVSLSKDYQAPPLVITENGSAFTDTVGPDGQVHDPRRLNYLQEHIAAVRAAIADGADVRGYFVWSLLDNFEWAMGYSMRFGIVYVDFETQKRVIKDSGRWYAQMIAENVPAPRTGID